MSETIAPPPDQPPARRRRALPLLSQKPETRAVQIGILGTILLHLLVILIAPHFLRFEQVRSATRSHVTPQFNIQIDPNSFSVRKPAPKPPQQFVEANHAANNKVPEKTNNFSDQNQQVAQEKPTPNGKNDHPALQGQKKIKTLQIVDGRLTKLEEPVPVAPPTPSKPAVVATHRQAQNPLSGYEKTQGDDKEGYAANLAKPLPNDKLIAEKIKGGAEESLSQTDNPASPQIDRLHPQERRSLEQHVRPAIFTDNDFGTANVGITAIDARFSNYGVYLKRMSEIVTTEWYGILNERRTATASGNFVAVDFKLNSKGEISEIVSVTPSPGTPDADVQACVAGIRDRSPYGPWTADMIATVGTETEMTYTFYYE